MLVWLNPAGPLHVVVTVTGTFTNVLSSTVQVRIISDPIGRTGLTGALVTITDVGGGTAKCPIKGRGRKKGVGMDEYNAIYQIGRK